MWWTPANVTFGLALIVHEAVALRDAGLTGRPDWPPP